MFNFRQDKPPVFWMTGRPGSGKTTLANAMHTALQEQGVKSVVLDGDNLRKGLCMDLGFTDEDRWESVRRIAHAAALFRDAGHIVIAATISPLPEHRVHAFSIIGDPFVETFISTPLALCAERDPKGMYAKAQRGELPNFTGVSSPYVEPTNAEIDIDTSNCTVDSATRLILTHARDYVRGCEQSRAVHSRGLAIAVN